MNDYLKNKKMVETVALYYGSLDKDKLLKIMTEGIEKSLNFDLSDMKHL